MYVCIVPRSPMIVNDGPHDAWHPNCQLLKWAIGARINMACYPLTRLVTSPAGSGHSRPQNNGWGGDHSCVWECVTVLMIASATVVCLEGDRRTGPTERLRRRRYHHRDDGDDACIPWYIWGCLLRTLSSPQSINLDTESAGDGGPCDSHGLAEPMGGHTPTPTPLPLPLPLQPRASCTWGGWVCGARRDP